MRKRLLVPRVRQEQPTFEVTLPDGRVITCKDSFVSPMPGDGVIVRHIDNNDPTVTITSKHPTFSSNSAPTAAPRDVVEDIKQALAMIHAGSAEIDPDFAWCGRCGEPIKQCACGLVEQIALAYKRPTFVPLEPPDLNEPRNRQERRARAAKSRHNRGHE